MTYDALISELVSAYEALRKETTPGPLPSLLHKAITKLKGADASIQQLTAELEAEKKSAATSIRLYHQSRDMRDALRAELDTARGAIRELEHKVFGQEQAIVVLQTSVQQHQRDIADPPGYLQDAVIRAAGLGVLHEQRDAAVRERDAMRAELTRLREAEHALSIVVGVFGTGAAAPEPHIVAENVRNARRRSQCLSLIERHHTVKVTDGGDEMEECPLHWGDDPEQYIKTYRSVVAGLLAAAGPVPPGWRLAPVVATPEMRNAGHSAVVSHGITVYADASLTWDAMLAVAPQPPARQAKRLTTSEISAALGLYDADGFSMRDVQGRAQAELDARAVENACAAYWGVTLPDASGQPAEEDKQ